MLSSFHVLEKMQNLEGDTGTQLGEGFLRKHVYWSSRCVCNTAGLRPLKLTLYCFFNQSFDVDKHKAKLHFQVVCDDEMCRDKKY